jgi:hypothetical protein
MALEKSLVLGIDFGGLDQGNQIQAAPDNNGTGVTNYSIKVLVSGCSPNQVDVWTRVNDTLNKSASVYIPYERYYHRYNTTNSSVPGTSQTSYSKTYQSIGQGLYDQNRTHLKFFINVSYEEPGSYSTFTWFKANLTTGG